MLPGNVNGHQYKEIFQQSSPLNEDGKLDYSYVNLQHVECVQDAMRAERVRRAACSRCNPYYRMSNMRIVCTAYRTCMMHNVRETSSAIKSRQKNVMSAVRVVGTMLPQVVAGARILAAYPRSLGTDL